MYKHYTYKIYINVIPVWIVKSLNSDLILTILEMSLEPSNTIDLQYVRELTRVYNPYIYFSGLSM